VATLVVGTGIRSVEQQAEAASAGGRQAAGADHRRQGGGDLEH